MAKITPPTFVDGMTPVANDLYRTFYSVDGDSFEVINGRLDATNIAKATDATKIGYPYVQSGAMPRGSGVAGTANLDYFSGNINATPEGSGHFVGIGFPPKKPNHYIPIPGACVDFKLPYDAYVLITWSITWTNDCRPDPETQTPERITDIALFIDGKSPTGDVATDPYSRCVGATFFGVSGEEDLQDRYKSRVYSGHCFIDGRKIPALKAGYHSVSLRISQHNAIKQSRVRARSMQYMYFKYGDT